MRRFRIGSIILLLVICICGQIYFALNYLHETKKLIQLNDAISQNYILINQTQNILSDTNLALSQKESFIITRNNLFDKQYEMTVERIKKNVNQVKRLNIHTAAQIDHLFTILMTQLTELNTLSRTTHLSQNTNALEKTFLDFGQTHKIADAMINTEEQLLNTKIQHAIYNTQHSIRTAITGAAITFLLIALCFILLIYQLLRHFKMERKLKVSKKRLYKLAYFNGLTELPNRAFLIQRIKGILKEKNHHISIIHLNIDNFKDVNHSFGYELGDEIIKIIGGRLKEITRDKIILSHFEGNEFVLLTQDFSHEEIISLIQRLSQVGSKMTIDNQHISLNVSIGIDENSVESDPELLLKNANLAMHRVKEHGKNNFLFCSPQLKEEMEGSARIGHHLHQAIMNQEFILQYQPKITLKDEKPSGVEVLIRWKHPKEGLVNPAKFISLAEKNGAILEMTEWMLKSACTQMKEWLDNGIAIQSIAINISPLQLYQNDFVQNLKSILMKTRLPAEYLELELTESVLIKNSEIVIETIRKIKNLGVHITIDDFGTGFSSLSYLRFLHIDKLKIDQTFIKEVNSSDHESPLIHSIILMAHRLGIEVTAEGIETREQVDFLKKTQCNEVQGYYFSKPIFASEIPQFFYVS